MEQHNTIDKLLTYGIDCPYIDILWKKGRIYISSAVFRLIGKSSSIRFQWNAAKRSLIIEPAEIENPVSVMLTKIWRIVIARAIARNNPEKGMDCFAPLAMTA